MVDVRTGVSMIANDRNERPLPRALSVGTSHPPEGYSQERVLENLKIRKEKLASIFRNAHIQNRYLVLPECPEGDLMAEETGLDLWTKHREWAVKLGEKAIERALKPLGATPRDVDYLVCVTSTGFLCPGITALLIKQMGFRHDVHRVDVVGMGCNAGLNALQPLANYCGLNPGKLGVQLCVEVCSAAYVADGSLRTTIVNSLFGDGAAAIVLSAQEPDSRSRASLRLLDFSSHIIPDAIDAMRFDYQDGRYSFFLDRGIPYTIGSNVEVPVDALLKRHGIKRRDIAHWVVHSGGQKVIDSVKYSLGLSDHDLRHTQSILRKFGNVSSGSFLFSLEQLLLEDTVHAGDYIMLMTMGPGSTIECCLGRF